LKSRRVVEVVNNFYQLEGSQGGDARDVLCVDRADSSLCEALNDGCVYGRLGLIELFKVFLFKFPRLGSRS
jgi:hypothetical protein